MPERESLDGAERLDALAGDGKKRLSNPDSILDGEISLGDGNKSKQSLPSVSGYQNWSKKSSAKESSAASKDLVAPQKGRSRSEAEIVDELLEKQSQAASQVVPEDEEEEIAFPQAASQVVSEDVGLAHEGGSGKEDAEDIIEELGMPDDIVEGVVGEKWAEQKFASKEGEQISEDVEMQAAAVENAAFEEEKAAEDVEMQEGEEKPDNVEAAAEVITPVVEPASVEAAAESEIEIGEGAEVAADEKIEDAEGVLPEEPIADEIGLPDALEPEVVAEKDEKVSDELKQEVKEEAPPSASPMEEASAPAFTQQAVAIGASSDSALPRASASVDEIDASAVWAAEQAAKTGSPSEELAAGLVGYEVEQEAAVDYEEVEAEGKEKGSFVPAETAKADVIEKSSDSADEAVQQVEVEKSVPVAPEAESKAAPVQPETKEDVAMEDVEEHGVESAAAAPPAVEARVFAEDDRDVEMAPAGSGSRDDELKGAAPVAAAGPLAVGEKVEENGCSEQEPLAKEEDVLEEKIVSEKKYSTRESFSFGGMAAPAVVEGEAEEKGAEPEPQGEDAIEADKSAPVELPKQPDVVFPADESAILKEDEDLDGDTIKESLHDLKSKDGASVSAAAGKGKGTSSATTGAAKGGKSKSAASSDKGNGKSASTIKGGNKKASTMGKSPRNASGGPRGASNKSPRQAAAASSKSPRQEAGAAHTSTTSPRHVVKGSGKAAPAAGASSVRPNTAKAPAAAAGAPPPVSTSAENGKASAATAMKKRPATAPANGGSTPLLKKQKTGPQGLTPSKRAEMETTEANRKSKLEDQLKSKAKKAEEAAKAKEQLKEVNLLRKEMGERLHSAICLVKRAKGGSWIVPDGEIRFDRVEFSVLTAMFPTCEWKVGSEPSTKIATATKNDAQQAFGVGKCKGGAQGVKAEVVGLKLTYAAKGKYLKMGYEMKTL